MRARGLPLVCLWLMLGCKPGDASVVEPAEGREPPVAGADASVVEPSLPPRFWVGGDGLSAYDFDGQRVASLELSGGTVRRTVKGQLVSVVHNEGGGLAVQLFEGDGALAGEFAVPNLADTETCSARVYPLADGEAVDEDELWGLLELQDADDFRLDPSGERACLTLMDRNINMADFMLEVAVNLADGSSEAVLEWDPYDACENGSLPHPCERGESEPWVEGVEGVGVEGGGAQAWAHSYDESTGVLSRDGEAVAELCLAPSERGADWDPAVHGCAETERRSSSGRYQLIRGELDDSGDYIYRELYLLDLDTGAVHNFACLEHSEGRGCSLTPVAVGELFGDERTPGYTVVGESEIATLPLDRFWIDGYLLIPERLEAVAVGGSLVWTTTAKSAG